MQDHSQANTDIERFDEYGYVLVRDVFDADALTALRPMLLDTFAKQGTNVISDAVLFLPAYREFLNNRRFVETLQTILGKPFVLPPHSSAEHHRFGVFHTDMTGAELNGQTFHQHPDYRMVTVAIYLQDNNEYGGGIRLVRGSHKRPDPYVELTRAKAAFRKTYNRSPLRRAIKRLSRGRLYDWDRPFRDSPQQLDIPSHVGDVVIWDMRVVHRATPQRIAKKVPEGGKIAIFFTAGGNNDITCKAYMDYVNSLPENDFVRQNRDRSDIAVPLSTDDYIIL